MRIHAALAIVPALLALACASPEEAAEEERGAPPPYTAEQIRDANPAGTELTYSIEQAGSPRVLRTMLFASGDADRTTVESTNRSASGEPLGAPESATYTWSELRSHAAFPPESTTRREASIEVAAGRFDGWIYTVSMPGADGARPGIHRFSFARERPGPPLLYEIEEAGAVVYRMELREVRRP